ncbi:polyamine aminopropyltransferase [Intestinibacillus massiliensis]|uniref:polyamine aminopropyltransferase n=1 Tax=Intestinibacillus massiliensis TaxID=1871029 RepID=UPI000B361358|nr:polyamine aminopropyltransferase [Intestinibacillus massiliensis]MCB6365070.1 polyamine aminopropyltransferase [Intestinibacillus massiliensis]
MDLWFTEEHTKHVRFSIEVDRQLYSAQSEFQRIDIFDSVEFGRFLALDGYMMLTERDEFIYHDMIVHVPMAVHPHVRNVLVIGAGDGGAIRELTRYPEIERIDMVEIDEMVVEACKQYLPQTAGYFDDPRVRLHFADGLRFVRRPEDEYDLIIVDSTDPFGPGEGLFTREFYGNCYKALHADGILVNQHESPYYENDALACQRAHRRITECFPVCRVYQAHIPTYPSGHWLFGFASKKYDPLADLDAARWDARGLKTRYYNTELHVGSFGLPNYVRELLDSADE